MELLRGGGVGVLCRRTTNSEEDADREFRYVLLRKKFH
jgi:hypothetical protein